MCLCACARRRLCGSAFAFDSLTFRRLSREHRFAESAFLQAALKLIETGSWASWSPESAEQEGNKGHSAVEKEEANSKAESIPQRIGLEKNSLHCAWGPIFREQRHTLEQGPAMLFAITEEHWASPWPLFTLVSLSVKWEQ